MSVVLYSIKDLERFSGIKAHTIRMWEQRYGLLHPTRTETNIRRYSDKDLKVLLNAAALNRLGYKISRIAAMTFDETVKILQSQTSMEGEQIHQLNVLRISMLNFNESLFLSAVQAIVESHGVEHTVQEVLGPFLVQIGVLWQTNAICPAHEHFISNLIRQFLLQEISKLDIPETTDETVVLFLPEDELHELGLLFLHFRMRSQGIPTVYLGQSVPAADLIQISTKFRAAHFVGYLINQDSTRVEKSIAEWEESGIFQFEQKMSMICSDQVKIERFKHERISWFGSSDSFYSSLR